jgi:predicted dehydrogenase
VAGDEVRVAMIGHAFMGGTHSVAWRSVNRAFDLPLQARMAVLCGRDEQRAAAAANRLGWAESSADWREVIARDDIDLVDICTPGDSHAEVAIAALAAGKHVLCEKPLANTVAEAEAMVAAAVSAQARGVRSMCGFNYRRTPAVAVMRRLVADGRIGEIRHVRAKYLQDWIVDPQFPLVWRLQKDRAGSGALGDIGAHIIDLTQYVTGQSITSVGAMTETFVKKRPQPGSTVLGEVTVDDAALFLVRLDGGAVGTYEATRFATGHKNGLSIELNGSLGSVVFDFERMNELQFHDATVPATEAGFTRILVTEPTHPYLEGWWPPGHPIGYEHTFTHEVRDLLADIAAGIDPVPSFADALQVQRVLDAVERSAADNVWTTVETALV